MQNLFRKFINSLGPFLLIPIAIFFIFFFLEQGNFDTTENVSAPFIILPQSPDMFSRVLAPQSFKFPEDHGPHEDYMTEWWYFTGNLEATSGQRFGYQLTFFRRAVNPEGLRADRASSLAAEQLYLAHFALTQVDSNQFNSIERSGRGSGGIAGAEPNRLHVWLEDWEVQQIDDGSYQLSAGQSDISVSLVLKERKAPTLQGNQGFSPKGSEPGNASYYYSLSRLETNGTIQSGDQTFQVEGLSWMDHEYSTSALAPDQIGWDWFSMQFDDGSELMLFQIRKEDGTIDSFSSGNFIDPDGTSVYLQESTFQIEVLATYQSPRSGAIYPSKWQITIPSQNISLNVEPLIADQELNLSFTYWEGAARISGSRHEDPVNGYGYVELTGYAHSMQGQF